KSRNFAQPDNALPGKVLKVGSAMKRQKVVGAERSEYCPFDLHRTSSLAAREDARESEKFRRRSMSAANELDERSADLAVGGVDTALQRSETVGRHERLEPIN